MIPNQSIEIEAFDTRTEIEPSKTYRLGGQISEKIDEREALKQFVHKVLSTEQGNYYIYDEYGIASSDLLGKDRDYMFFELCRRIKECLERDERILAVKDFREMEAEERAAIAISFFVETIYGEVKGEEVFNFAGQ